MQDEFSLIPDNQQEDEDDISSVISFKDAVVLNADWTIETINLQSRKEILTCSLVSSVESLGMMNEKAVY
ncbi:hypothetical protein A3710_19585 [Stutzerimonas frequens]|uniref:hypothetical protein n=1 Tax=Stutzerimonas frequens TaxID=2968969 RepID=UPI0007B7997C|nr:hypothetical protein [Stutzerimonas frequens]KZX60948.1 hypothetical protein A3710_19585 [Stutzerimonas frequens]